MLPIVDLAPFLASGSEESARQLGETLATVGFCYVVGHGLDQSELDRIFAVAHNFFKLPVDKKLSVARTAHTANAGYVAMHGESLDAMHSDAKEAYNVTGASLASDALFQDVLPSFRDDLALFHSRCWTVAHTLLRALSISLNLPTEHTLGKFHRQDEPNGTTLRLLRYPSADLTSLSAPLVAAGAHTDYGTLTILFTDDHGGLEVRQRDEWVAVEPLRDALVVNIGDLLCEWSNQRLRSTLHRVVRVPDTSTSSLASPRLSIAFFLHPTDSVRLIPLCEKEHSDTTECGSDALTAGEWLARKLARTY